MIFTNEHLIASERKFDFGTIHQLGMGEIGRGKKFLALTCPEGLELHKGINKNVSITYTISGKPRISNVTDNGLYMLLSSRGGYSLKGNGRIMVLKSKKYDFNLLARGNGADGKVGSWDCVLVKAPKNGIIYVRPSGNINVWLQDIYIIHNNNVIHCYPDNLEEVCASLNIDVPCKICYDFYTNKTCLGDDWTYI